MCDQQNFYDPNQLPDDGSVVYDNWEEDPTYYFQEDQNCINVNECEFYDPVLVENLNENDLEEYID